MKIIAPSFKSFPVSGIEKLIDSAICFFTPPLFCCILLVSFQINAFSDELHFFDGANPVIRIVDSNEQSIIIEFTADTSRIEKLSQQPNNMPPVYGALFGVPTIDNLSVQILDAEYITMRDYHVSTAPLFQPASQSAGNNYLDIQSPVSSEKNQNSSIYRRCENVSASGVFFPGALVELGYTGYLRDQPVAQAQWRPLQNNPLGGNARFYYRVRARLLWDSSHPQKTSSARYWNPSFENLLKNTLANYDKLNRIPAGENCHCKKHRGGGKATLPGRKRGFGHFIEDENALPPEEERQMTFSSNTPELKIGITEDGIYKITSEDLANAGWKLENIAPRKISMWNLEKEIPILVSGESDGIFDSGDYILFYGVSNKDIYTNKNVYWLNVGNKNGKRMSTKNGSITGNDATPDAFPAVFHAEEDSIYWQTIPNGWGEDHWFWGMPFNSPEERSYSFVLENISEKPGTATAIFRLKGRTDDARLIPDHHTRIYLNGVKIDDQHWEGLKIFDHRASIPQTLLKEGTNTALVESVGDTGAVVDRLLLNWIEIDYLDTYAAEDDMLLFAAPAPGAFQFEIKNFSGSNADVFDITDTENVNLIMNTATFKEKNAYTLTFKDIAAAETRYLALAPLRRKKPESITADWPTSWKSPLHGADYIVITHKDFYARSKKLARYRKAKGLRVATVRTEDIYDEFNAGVFNPKAIRDFLSYAYKNWKPPAPAYVVLIGDGCQDYKDNYRTGSLNYVPSQIVETEFLGETPSDNWYVCVNGDDILPDMLIGRLSAQTPAQVTDIIKKIILYEKNKQGDGWKENVLLVADDDDSIFEETSDNVASIIPQNYHVKKIYVRNYMAGEPKKDILLAMNEGNMFISYAGHGATDKWGIWNNTPIFENTDLPSLANEGKLAVVTVADCLNGFFTGIQTTFSLAEGFQRLQKKGAVAVWAPTGVGFPYGHKLLISEFYKEIFEKGCYELGAAETAAKISVFSLNNGWKELVETYLLFGDPVMRVAVPGTR